MAQQPVSHWIFQRNGNAVASVLIGLAGLLAFGVILGPIAIGLGVMATNQIRGSGQPGRNLATAGIVIGIVAFVMPILRALT